MYIDVVPNRNSPPAVLLRESFRVDGKIVKRTVANLSGLEPAVIESIRAALKGGSVSVPLETAFDVTRSIPHGHVAAVLATIRNNGLDRILSSRPSSKREIVIAMLVARIIHPVSKLATATAFSGNTTLSSIPEELGIGEVDENDLYDAMDWLLTRQHDIETSFAQRHLQDGCLVLYDVSSSYFEGTKCPLARHGHSRDGKKELLQIVYGVLTNADGCPVAIEVFSGNTADPSTVPAQIRKLQQRFGLSQIVFVGDRGMITSARIREDFLDTDGIDWITALRAPDIQDLVHRGLFQPSLFDDMDLAEITDPERPRERLVICRNHQLAAERRRKRDELLAATERELRKIVRATQRERCPLRGEAKIGQRFGVIANRWKMAKHFRFEIRSDHFSFRRDEQKIALERSLDGFYIVRTSIPLEKMDAPDVVRSYKRLSRVERAFRCLKSVDLRIRPIHHTREDRVRAHVFLCFLAYHVEWHMRQCLKPLIFAEEFEEQARIETGSVVQAARRSSATMAKIQSRESIEDGLTLQTFHGLLDSLGTITKNTILPTGKSGKTFEKVTSPNKVQAKALSLLGVRSLV